jgi:hypothetical protein
MQPKLELPDYPSDGESKAGAASFLGLESNSVDVSTSFAAALQGKWCPFTVSLDGMAGNVSNSQIRSALLSGNKFGKV